MTIVLYIFVFRDFWILGVFHVFFTMWTFRNLLFQRPGESVAWRSSETSGVKVSSRWRWPFRRSSSGLVRRWRWRKNRVKWPARPEFFWKWKCFRASPMLKNGVISPPGTPNSHYKCLFGVPGTYGGYHPSYRFIATPFTKLVGAHLGMVASLLANSEWTAWNFCRKPKGKANISLCRA